MSRRPFAVAIALLPGLACGTVYSESAAPPGRVYAVPSPGPTESVSPTPARPGSASPTAPPAPELANILGRLVWPLATDRASALTSDYGRRDRPGGGGSRFHSGLDLRAPEGTPVYAAADGTVVRSETKGGYGSMIVITHGAELESLYAHHSRNLAAAGDRVRRGEVIALVGHSGNATGDHLHFELRWRGGTVDPWTVLPALRSATAR